jgi:hypothetical protein
MTVILSPVGGVAAQFFDNNGNPLSGGKLFSYVAGTTTPAVTYTSSLGTTAHTNPIVLDSGGRVPSGEIWLTDGAIYKFVLQTSTNVLIATYDNISGISGLTLPVDSSNITYDPPIADGVSTNVEAKLAQNINIKDFGAIGNGVANDSAAFANAIDYLSSNTTLFFPPGVYLLSSQVSKTLTSFSNVKLIGDGAVIKFGIDQPTGSRLITFNSCVNITVEGLTIDGDAHIANVFFFNSCSNVKFTNNTIQKLWRTSTLVDGFGLTAEDCDQFVIANNMFWRTNKAVAFDDGGTTSTNVTIDANVIKESGFGAVILPHRNSVISNNAVEYTGLGPFFRAYGSGITITRTDMRNNAWVPTPVTADYGTGKGTAFNTGSNTLASGSYPFNLVISNNSFNETAEYPMGIESGRFVSTVELAGPAEHITITGNTFEKSGTQHLFLTGLNGCSIVGNHFGISALNGISTEAAVALITRTVDATFSGRSAAEKIQNGNQNITITGNTFKDLSGSCAKGIYIDQANIERCTNNISIADNTFQFNIASATGIQYDNTAGVVQPAYGIKVIGNTFINDQSPSGGYVSAWGVDINWGVYAFNTSFNMGGVVSLTRFINSATNYTNDAGVDYPVRITPNASGVIWTAGAGSPEGVLTANVGSLYTRSDGGAATTLYIKESGTGNTGWVAK